MLFDESKNCEKAMGLMKNYFLHFKIFLKPPKQFVYNQIIVLLVTNPSC
jgi:hypothetical protein